MADRVMSAPLAIIKVGGVAVGKMKNIRCTESYRNVGIVGLGTILPSEFATVGWTGTMNVGAFLIDLRRQMIPGTMLRTLQTPQQWEDTVLLRENSVQVDIMRKVLASTTVAGLAIPVLELVASIKGCFIERESFDISEGQIGGRDADFVYSTPFLFPL